jgi:hypothetical protein
VSAKRGEDDRLLARKRRIEAERREKAIARRKQEFLRATTPGVATPATVMPPRRKPTDEGH